MRVGSILLPLTWIYSGWSFPYRYQLNRHVGAPSVAHQHTKKMLTSYDLAREAVFLLGALALAFVLGLVGVPVKA